MGLTVARTLLIGVLATVLAVVVWLVTSAFDLNAPNGLIGVAAGALLGLIRDRSPLARYGAFLIGLLFGLLALVAGMAGWIGFVVAIIILTVISALTGGRLPLWAMILGSGTLAAMYTSDLVATAWFVLTQYPSTLLLALATSAGGFIAAVFVELIYVDVEEKPEERKEEEQAAALEQLAYPAYNAAVSDSAIGGEK